MLDRKGIVRWGLVLAVVIELITMAFRFGLDLQSTRDTTFVSKLTFGLRIHHGYVGVVMILVALWISARSGPRNLLYVVGIALIVSDLLHHFAVLWPITGSPEFDLVYPAS